MVVLFIELIFELGFYEPFVKKESHSGTSIQFINAVKELGYENIDYVTLGDSRGNRGLNHSRVLEASGNYGQVHISLAMPGSHLMTFDILSDWLHKDFTNLKGVLILISSGSMLRTYNGTYELGIVEPFRSIGDYQSLKYVPLEIHNVDTYGSIFSLFQYREDIMDFFLYPYKRLKSFLFAKKLSWADVITRANKNDFNICPINTETPDACLDSVKKIIDSAPDMPAGLLRNYEGVETVCERRSKRLAMPETGQIEGVKDSWRQLVSSLHFKNKPIVVLVPNHSFIEKYQYPPETDEWALSILRPMAENNEIILIDFSKRFNGKEECLYFMDPLHLNSLGMETITNELLPVLRTYYLQ